MLLAGTADSTTWLWNADENSLLNVFSGHGGSVTCGDVTPDGTNFSSYFLDRSSFIYYYYYPCYIFYILHFPFT
jgi:angio-associated migratory cell protein